MDEFTKYMGDYLRDNPDLELTYWGNYPPHGEKGEHYAIFAHRTSRGKCPTCGIEQILEIGLVVEKGLKFEIETDG